MDISYVDSNVQFVNSVMGQIYFYAYLMYQNSMGIQSNYYFSISYTHKDKKVHIKERSEEAIDLSDDIRDTLETLFGGLTRRES